MKYLTPGVNGALKLSSAQNASLEPAFVSYVPLSSSACRKKMRKHNIGLHGRSQRMFVFHISKRVCLSRELQTPVQWSFWSWSSTRWNSVCLFVFYAWTEKQLCGFCEPSYSCIRFPPSKCFAPAPNDSVTLPVSLMRLKRLPHPPPTPLPLPLLPYAFHNKRLIIRVLWILSRSSILLPICTNDG